MGKRKLTRRQQWRIKKIQEERLKRADNKQQKLIKTDQKLEDDLHHGTVVSHFGASLDIEDLQSQQLIRCALRQNIESIVCGDKVVWQKLIDIDTHEQVQGVVTALQPRQSVLARPDFTGQMKPIAANIDQLLIVTSPVPELNEGLIDRYLVAAELSHIAPVIIFNKIDIVSEKERKILEERIQLYHQLNYPILYTSAKSEQGLQSLIEQLENKTSVFVGQSGVGKSSLINALIPDANIKEGAVSEMTNKGTHTTSVSRLYHIYQSQLKNASLIDSPGVREFGLWNIKKEDVIHGFIELYNLSQQCRFRDCQHLNEPGCAILEAISEQQVSQQRLDSYHRIIDSINQDSNSFS